MNIRGTFWEFTAKKAANGVRVVGTTIQRENYGSMTEEVRNHMRARIEKCRRLAKYINDPRTTEALLAMAAEGEADLAKLEAAENVPQEPEPKLSQGPLA